MRIEEHPILTFDRGKKVTFFYNGQKIEGYENETVADKYEKSSSALRENLYKDGKESVTDLTRFAFANARTNPEKFKAELKAQIEKMLAEVSQGDIL